MKKTIIFVLSVVLIAIAVSSVWLYRIKSENSVLKAELEEESLYRLESRLWQERDNLENRKFDEEIFLDFLHGTEIKDGKLAVYFYQPEGKEEAWFEENIKTLLSGNEDRITLFFYDIDMIRDFHDDFKAKVEEEGIYYLTSDIDPQSGHLLFTTVDAWFLKLVNLSKQYSYENNIMIDVED